jgi:hypothetical protein
MAKVVERARKRIAFIPIRNQILGDIRPSGKSS